MFIPIFALAGGKLSPAVSATADKHVINANQKMLTCDDLLNSFLSCCSGTHGLLSLTTESYIIINVAIWASVSTLLLWKYAWAYNANNWDDNIATDVEFEPYPLKLGKSQSMKIVAGIWRISLKGSNVCLQQLRVVVVYTWAIILWNRIVNHFRSKTRSLNRSMTHL